MGVRTGMSGRPMMRATSSWRAHGGDRIERRLHRREAGLLDRVGVEVGAIEVADLLLVRALRGASRGRPSTICRRRRSASSASTTNVPQDVRSAGIWFVSSQRADGVAVEVVARLHARVAVVRG